MTDGTNGTLDAVYVASTFRGHGGDVFGVCAGSVHGVHRLELAVLEQGLQRA